MKRASLFLALLSFGALARGAELVRPVQLSLDFAAAPAVAPLPSLPASPILAAFHTGDAAQFLAAVRASEYAVPAGDEQQQRLLQEGLAREEADRIFLSRSETAVPAASSSRRATKIDYAEFGRRVERLSGLSLNIFQQTDTKRGVLEDAGYTHLTGPGGRRIPLADADPVRVGKAFAHVHKTWLNRGRR